MAGRESKTAILLVASLLAGCLAPAPPVFGDGAADEMQPVAPPISKVLAEREFTLGSGPGAAATHELPFMVDRGYDFLAIHAGFEGVWPPNTVQLRMRVLDPHQAVRLDITLDLDGNGTSPGVATFRTAHPVLRGVDMMPFASVVAPGVGAHTLLVDLKGPIAWAKFAVRGHAGAAPAFKTEDALGKGTFELEKHRGKVVLLKVFETDCKETQAKMPALVDLYRSLNRSQVEFVSVSHWERDTQETLRTFMGTYGATWFAGLDNELMRTRDLGYDNSRNGTVERAYGARGSPVFSIIDANGRWIYQQASADVPTLRGVIESLLAVEPAA